MSIREETGIVPYEHTLYSALTKSRRITNVEIVLLGSKLLLRSWIGQQYTHSLATSFGPPCCPEIYFIHRRGMSPFVIHRGSSKAAFVQRWTTTIPASCGQSTHPKFPSDVKTTRFRRNWTIPKLSRSSCKQVWRELRCIVSYSPTIVFR